MNSPMRIFKIKVRNLYHNKQIPLKFKRKIHLIKEVVPLRFSQVKKVNHQYFNQIHIVKKLQASRANKSNNFQIKD